MDNTRTSYRQFIILCTARTGSRLLGQALNSHPEIRCFDEIFNPRLPYVAYALWVHARPGQDGGSAKMYGKGGKDKYYERRVEDMALRAENPARFLEERIFCEHPDGTHAVGFKAAYEHISEFSGVVERLRDKTELHVIHLKRRNLLRLLTSLKIAKMTGVWFEGDPKARLGKKLTARNALRAVRHPWQAAVKVRGLWKGPDRPAINISVDEFKTFIDETQRNISHFDSLFREHPLVTVHYEDLVNRRQQVFDQVQKFLGVKTQPFTTTLRRQNPDTLNDLISNYDELYDAFKGGPYQEFFE